MKKFNLLKDYPAPKKPRYVSPKIKKIYHRIVASKRGEKFFDGERNYGYGGYKYDGRWKKFAKKIINKYNLRSNSSILHINCEKGFLLNDLKEENKKFNIFGLEYSKYAIKNSLRSVKKKHKFL